MKQGIAFLIIILGAFSLPAGERIRDNRIVTMPERSGICHLRPAGAAVTNSSGKPAARQHLRRGVYTIAHWTQSGDRAFWHVRAMQAGEYRVILELACDRRNAGSDILVKSGASAIRFSIPSTRSWNIFRFVPLSGTLSLRRSRNRISVIPGNIKHKNLMMLRRMLLIPSDKKNVSTAFIQKIRNSYSRRQRANTVFNTGLRLYRKKWLRRSLVYFRKACRIDPSFHHARYYTGVVTRRLGRHRRAIRHLEAALKLYPAHYWNRLYLVWTYAKLKQYTKALLHTDRLIVLQKALGKKLWAGALFNASVYARMGKRKDYRRSVAYLRMVYKGPYPEEQRDKALSIMATVFRYGKFYKDFIRLAEKYIREGRDSYLKANHCYNLGHYYKKRNRSKSRLYFQRAVSFYTGVEKQLPEMKQVNALRGRGLSWYYLEEYPQALRDLRAAYRLQPKRHIKSKIRWSANYIGIDHLIHFRYGQARRYFKLGERFRTGRDSYYSRFMFLADNHGRYRNVKPHYVHRILQLYVLRTDATTRDHRGRIISYKGQIKPWEMRKIRTTNRMLKLYLETLTKGKLSIRIDRYLHRGTYRRVNSTRKANGKFYYTPDIHSITGGIYEKMQRFSRKYDSIQYYWKAGKFLSVATGGAVSVPLIPYTLWGPIRGYNSMPVEFARFTGSGIPLHEFWHTMENTITMGPCHGWKKDKLPEARRRYPDWRGRGEWSWYLYHVKNTFPKDSLRRAKLYNHADKPYWVINFLHRFARKYPPELVLRLRKMSGNISTGKRRIAAKYKDLGRKLEKEKKYAAAARMYKKALQNNSCLVYAVRRLIGIACRRKNRGEELKYRKYLIKIMPTRGNLFHCGQQLVRMKRYVEAESVFRRGYRHFNDNAFLSLIARLYIRIGQREKSALLLKKVSDTVIRQREKSLTLNASEARIHSDRWLSGMRVYGRVQNFVLGYWTRQREYISWKVDIKNTGRYRIVLYSSCSKKRSGARMRLSIGDVRLYFRVPASRSYSYYRRTELRGTVFLNAGTHRVVLRAAGKKAAGMNFQKLVLERVE